MGNTSIPSEVWLKATFEFENCDECGLGAEHHEACIVLGNWFARCLPPAPAIVQPLPSATCPKCGGLDWYQVGNLRCCWVCAEGFIVPAIGTPPIPFDESRSAISGDNY